MSNLQSYYWFQDVKKYFPGNEDPFNQFQSLKSDPLIFLKLSKFNNNYLSAIYLKNINILIYSYCIFEGIEGNSPSHFSKTCQSKSSQSLKKA